VDPTVHRAYVANYGSHTVTVIDTTTKTVVGGPVPVWLQPFAVGIGP
jgi:YVTN family beta-propeller protein